MSDNQTIHPFIRYLDSLAEGNNRGALADLRRGLTGNPGSTPAMFQYVTKWIPVSIRNTWQEKVFYMISALYAYYQSGAAGKVLRATKGNFGSHCRSLVQKEKQSASFEKRFMSLLKAHPEDLHILLRQVVSLLKGAEIPINWNQLFYDLQHWNSESQYVQRQWANSYWPYAETETNNLSQNQEE